MKGRLTRYFFLSLGGIFVCIFAWMSFLIYLFFGRQEIPENPLTANYLKKIAVKTQINTQRVQIDSQILTYLRQQQIWLQVLNEKGEEIYSFHRPTSIPRHYALGQLVAYQNYPTESGYHISTWYEKVDGHIYTWVTGGAPARSHKGYVPESEQYQYTTYLVAGWIVIILLIATFSAFRLGNPLLHTWSWLQQLADGDYSEPLDRKGRPRSLNRSGKIKLSYRIYREVIDSLYKLTQTLKQNEQDRIRLEKTREEWMTGVSHDLKTPLSTVKGYIEILSTEKYELDKHELDFILKTLGQRVKYMEELIHDFNLTFRLKNNALPLHKEKENIVELLRESIIDCINLPKANEYEFDLDTNTKELYDVIDRKWYKRAIDNLLGNAIKHNPPGTKIQAQLKQLDQGYEIVIRDNGKGMDHETKVRLFERYFRGTNSNQNSLGTGLGMTIAYQLIQVHGGRIHLHSNLNEGTKIVIRFTQNRG
jgi:signal transduction histidine kinase